ncbi:bleomycin resistance protein [Phytoactinopolyspora limicola]|uniref:bleomycin resistance protein n=1 Tax=Phytoactinopolyspora limicola TaxID=2715536 RepID=UPI00140A4877|nr:VOC family protein [Phytoactinopolyspora limicola]
MSAETVIPGLPCRDLNDVLPFYEALGFDVTYRQERPNPYAAVRRGGIELHFFAIPEFDPNESMGNVMVLVPDTGALHAAFSAGLRESFGKVPIAGIPRMTRPRRMQGTRGGFMVVDPGGNWLRISRQVTEGDADPDGGPQDQPTPAEGRLARSVAAAARQADSHGDEATGIQMLENALARHADAPPHQRIPALVYLAELRMRIGHQDSAAALLAEVRAMDVPDVHRDMIANDLATAAELAAQLAT